MTFKIAYYAHHFGTGHLRHAQRMVELPGMELQVASTGPRRDNLLPGVVDYVELPPDDGPGQHPGKMGAGESLHYAPVGPVIQQRFADLNRAWARFSPDVIMVDVSVEVALFARLSGYPVAMRRMPGDRSDRAHQLAYEVSDALFGYFPAALEDQAHLTKYGVKSYYLGVPERVAPPAQLGSTTGAHEEPKRVPKRVVVQTSLASAIPIRHIAAAAASSPEWQWEVAGAVQGDTTCLPSNLLLHGVLASPASLLRGADVVVTSAGHNAVVAAAASGTPTLLIAEDRPHDEQLHFARALNRSAGLPQIDSWTTPTDWSAVLDQMARSVPGALASSLFVEPHTFQTNLELMLTFCIQSASP